MTAVYVHHHLRAEADADAKHVQAVCEAMDLAVEIQHVHPAEMGGNLADAARKLRYEALLQAAIRAGAGHVAVGHHAEDQLETMLMALCRGSGLDGLSAMAWRRPLGEGVFLVRPLLASRKAACESLCAAAGIDWREDVSNLDTVRTRARLRADVLPVLEELWPGAAVRAASTADVLAAAGDLVAERLNDVFGDASQRCWLRDSLRSLAVPLIAAGIRRAVGDAVGETGDAIGQRQLLPAAAAIADENRRPRVFGMVQGLRLRVTAREVQLESCDRPCSI